MNEQQPVDAAGTPKQSRLFAVFDAEIEAGQAERALSAEGVRPQRLEGHEAAQMLRKPDDVWRVS